MDEREIVDMISKEASYQDVLEYVITEAGMDPWDIDIVKLADAFRAHVIVSADFRLPARLIIISAILLRMKAEILLWEEEQERIAKSSEITIDLSKVPDLQPPSKRAPPRRVTMEELMHALEKAFATEERRVDKEMRARRNVEELVEAEETFDVNAKIKDLYARITQTLAELRDGELAFSSLVTKWDRKEIVQSLLSVLHMSVDGVVTVKQEEPFQEIFIKVKGSDYGEGKQESTA